MRKIRRRIKDLSSRAAQFKEALESVPGKVAEIRQTLTRTVEDFQQLKNEFQISSSAFPEVMEQITHAADIIEEAGYSLEGVDMDIGLNPKLVIHLDRVEEVDISRLRSLKQDKDSNVALRSLLEAIIKAEEMSAKIEIPDMSYRELAVEIGMAPSVRLVWRTDFEPEPASPSMTASPSASTPSPSSTFFGSSSYFDPRPETGAATRTAGPPENEGQTPAEKPESAPVVAAAVSSMPARETSPPKKGAANWQAGALDRFKKMPDLSR